MITEIAKFVETIPENYHTKNLQLSKGLYVCVDLDDQYEPIKETYKSIVINKKGKMLEIKSNSNSNSKNDEWVEYNGDLAIREYYSSLIEMNKSLDKSKKIHSSNAYSIWFKRQNILNVKDSFQGYFNKVVVNASEKTRAEYVEKIKIFCEKKLLELIKCDKNYNYKGKDKNKKTETAEYSVGMNDYIKVFFLVPVELLKEDFENYLKNNLLNNQDGNASGNEIFGLSGFLNGANSKKPFMQHKTTNFNFNNKITQTTAINLYRFERLLSHKKPYDKLPNPLPIFIDNDELNKAVVKLYNDDRVLHFREIIKRIFEQHEPDISDYYLINWRNTTNGPAIFDFDFVPQFKYKLEGCEIRNPMEVKDFQVRKIDNIFQFELDVVRIIFNNALVVKTKEDEVLLKYFDEIDSKYMSATTYQNILKYRKSFYDYIYKSRTQAITGKIFYDTVMTSVIDDIKRDEKLKKTYTVKEKLNILFSLNHIFDTNNNNFKGVNMASKIPQYQEWMRKLFSDENYHITEDDEFAFATGQLIYFILNQSKSTNKSHALLEPFISKSDPVQFRQMIVRGINQYKHAFEWYGNGKGRFEKLVGDILGYECKTNIKEMLPIILAGYFSKSLIYESLNINKTNE